MNDKSIKSLAKKTAEHCVDICKFKYEEQRVGVCTTVIEQALETVEETYQERIDQLERVCESARDAIANHRVPQTLKDVAIDIAFTLGPVLKTLEKVIDEKKKG